VRAGGCDWAWMGNWRTRSGLDERRWAISRGCRCWLFPVPYSLFPIPCRWDPLRSRAGQRYGCCPVRLLRAGGEPPRRGARTILPVRAPRLRGLPTGAASLAPTPPLVPDVAARRESPVAHALGGTPVPPFCDLMHSIALPARPSRRHRCPRAAIHPAGTPPIIPRIRRYPSKRLFAAAPLLAHAPSCNPPGSPDPPPSRPRGAPNRTTSSRWISSTFASSRSP
jgi:hypothetical protein